MNLSRIHEFLVLAKHLNYSKAANLLYLTQPVLSRHIHALEEELNAQLFVRDTHKVELTNIGRLCEEEFTKLMECYNEVMGNITESTDTKNSTLSVGILGRAAKPFIVQFSNTFNLNYPNIHINYTSTDLAPLISGVENDTYDVAFISHIDATKFNNFDVKHISYDNLCAVVPSNSKFIGRESISISELNNTDIISFQESDNPHVAHFYDNLFEKFNVKPNVVKYVNNVDSGLFYSDLGLGIFIIPKHLTFMATNQPIVNISDPEAKISLSLIWKKNNTKGSLKTFIHSFTNFHKEIFN